MSDDFLAVPLAAIALPAVLVPMVMALRHAAVKRDNQHRERMKALETGQPVPGESGWPAAFACASVGAGVPLGSFLFTWLASVSTPRLPGEIWFAPAVVSLVAILCSMGIAGAMPRQVKAPAARPLGHGKSMVHDPDAYDVVDSRG